MAITVSTQYADRIDALADSIRHAMMLRDAQVPESDQYKQYQAECTELTHRMEAWKEHAPRLDELDEAIARHDRDLRSSKRHAEAEVRNMWQGAGTCWALALLAALLYYNDVITHWLAPVAALALIVLGAVAGTRPRSIQRDQAAHESDVGTRRDALTAEREQLRTYLNYYD